MFELFFFLFEFSLVRPPDFDGKTLSIGIGRLLPVLRVPAGVIDQPRSPLQRQPLLPVARGAFFGLIGYFKSSHDQVLPQKMKLKAEKSFEGNRSPFKPIIGEEIDIFDGSSAVAACCSWPCRPTWRWSSRWPRCCGWCASSTFTRPSPGPPSASLPSAYRSRRKPR